MAVVYQPIDVVESTVSTHVNIPQPDIGLDVVQISQIAVSDIQTFQIATLPDANQSSDVVVIADIQFK